MSKIINPNLKNLTKRAWYFSDSLDLNFTKWMQVFYERRGTEMKYIIYAGGSHNSKEKSLGIYDTDKDALVALKIFKKLSYNESLNS